MNKFTRGEWKAYPDGSIDVEVNGRTEHSYADLISADDEALAANAKLIAAAPEMYELLRRFANCRHEDDMFDIMECAQDLIARIDSEGENE